MAKIKRSANVNYSAEDMFKLGNDVKAYPEFLPGCVGAHIQQQGQYEMVARLDIAKAGIHKTFTTHNKLTPYHSIRIELIDGPFQHLNGWWRFVEVAEHQCRIEFEFDFEFHSKLIEFAFGGIFGELMGAMVYAFTHRAKEVYDDTTV